MHAMNRLVLRAGFVSIFTLLCLCFSQVTIAQEPLEIDIEDGQVEPVPIAITDLHAEQASLEDIGRQMAEVIRRDLSGSGLFRSISPRAFLQPSSELVDGPRFGDWRILNAQALSAGQIRSIDGGRFQMDIRLWDVFSGNQLEGVRFTAEVDQWRKVAHRAANLIFERITGEAGYFESRIVYVAESGPATARKKQIAIMDQDGANHRLLTNGANLVLTPRFQPDGSAIAFMIFRGLSPKVYLVDLETGREQILGDFPGMTFAPRFDPTQPRAALTLAEGGNSDIYLLDLETAAKTRLTRHPAIDTSPSFSPDGRRIVFNSDRDGGGHLYVMNSNGTGVQRISFDRGRYGSPVWSPRGDWIAFSRIRDGKFHIGVMRPDGSDERLLTRSYLDEGPTWSPNGRLIMFSRRRSGADEPRLMSIDVTGFNEREIPTPRGATDPDWSLTN